MLKGKTKCTYGTLKIPDINIVAIISLNIKFPLPALQHAHLFLFLKNRTAEQTHFSPSQPYENVFPLPQPGLAGQRAGGAGSPAAAAPPEARGSASLLSGPSRSYRLFFFGGEATTEREALLLTQAACPSVLRG